MSTPDRADYSLRDLVVASLDPYDIPTGAWSPDEKVEPAEAVLAALSRAGFSVVPTDLLRDIRHCEGLQEWDFRLCERLDEAMNNASRPAPAGGSQ